MWKCILCQQKTMYFHSTACLLWMFLLFNLSGNDAAEPRSGVCSKTNLTNGATCVQQLPPTLDINSDDCVFKYFTNNTTECSQLIFPTFTSSGSDDIVELKAYHFDNLFYQLTAFNTTFLINSDSKDVVIRFLQLNGYKKGHSLCIQLTVYSKVDFSEIPGNLFFDCIWAEQQYEGNNYQMDVWETNTKKHWIYRFKVPASENINPSNTDLTKWEVFMYLHISSLPNMILTFQELPEAFHIQQYAVELKKVEEESLRVISSQVVQSDGKQHLRRVEFDNPTDAGQYLYTVQAQCKDLCESRVVESLQLEIKKHNFEDILIGVICSITILLVVGLTIFTLWKRYEFLVWDMIKQRKPPLVLISYIPTFSEHIQCIESLAKYLQKGGCHVEPLLDLWHIRKSNSKDPYLWIVESMEKVNFILIIASPTPFVNNEQAEYEGTRPIYKNTNELVIAYIKNQIPKELAKADNVQIQNKCFVAIPPYASVHDVPKEVRLLKKFYLMDEFNQMLCHIHQVNFKTLLNMKHFFPTLNNSQPKGTGKEDTEMGRELLTVMEMAKNVMKKKNNSSVRHKQEEKIKDCNKLKNRKYIGEGERSEIDIQSTDDLKEERGSHEASLLPKPGNTDTKQALGPVPCHPVCNSCKNSVHRGEKKVECEENGCSLLMRGNENNMQSVMLEQKNRYDEKNTFGDYLPCVTDLLSVTSNQSTGHNEERRVLKLNLF